MELVQNLGTIEVSAKLMALKDRLNSFLVGEETFLCQRLKVFWMWDGDMSS